MISGIVFVVFNASTIIILLSWSKNVRIATDITNINIKYVTVFATGQDMAAADSLFFANFIGQEYAPLVFFFIFLGLTALIVVFGVEKGIEKVSKYLMRDVRLPI